MENWLSAAPVERLVGPASCPCCNSDAFVFSDADGFSVECESCGLKTKHHATSEAAKHVWNKRFDGQYGISARELEARVVTVMRQWFDHWSRKRPLCLEQPERHPLEQVVSGCLSSMVLSEE